MAQVEIMADGSEHQEIEVTFNGSSRANPEAPKLPFEKDHLPGMEHLREEDQSRRQPPSAEQLEKQEQTARDFLAGKVAEVVQRQVPSEVGQINPQQVAGEMLQPTSTAASTEFTPEHPLGTEGQLPKTNIRPEQARGMADVMPSLNIPTLEWSVGEIRTWTESMIASQEANIRNRVLPDSPVALILGYQDMFNQLIAAKTARGRAIEVPEISQIQKEFIVRLTFGYADGAIAFGAGAKVQELVAADIFRDVFRSVWDIVGTRPIRPDDPRIPPRPGPRPGETTPRTEIGWVTVGVDWIEKNKGKCFIDPPTDSSGHIVRDPVTGRPRKPDGAAIIERIAQQYRDQGLDPEKSKLAATLVYRLYLVTGDIIRFTGPVDEHGQPMGEKIIGEVFGRDKVEIGNDELWNRWRDYWQDLVEASYEEADVFDFIDRQLAGSVPLLWQKVALTPAFILTQHPPVAARGLAWPWGNMAFPLSNFLGCRTLTEVYQRQERGEPINFFNFSLTIGGANTIADKLTIGGYLNRPLKDAKKAFEDPEKNMPGVFELLFGFKDNNQNSLFNFLARYEGGDELPAKFRSNVLAAELNWVNTNEGQKVTTIWGEGESRKYFGRSEDHYAIKAGLNDGFLDETRSATLYRHFNATGDTNITVKGIRLLDNTFLGGGLSKVWRFIRPLTGL